MQQWCEEMKDVKPHEIECVVSTKGKTPVFSTLFPEDTFMYLCGQRGPGRPAYMYVSSSCQPDSDKWAKHLLSQNYIHDFVSRYMTSKKKSISQVVGELQNQCVGTWVPFC